VQFAQRSDVFFDIMRSFELLLILAVIAAAASLRFAARWSPLLTLLSVLFCALHVVREGTHWQMIPVIIGLIPLVVWQLIPAARRVSRYLAMKNRVAVSIAFLSLTTFAMLLLVPMFSLPKPTGPYPVGTRIIYVKDSSRMERDGPHPGTPRELIVQIWYPAAPSKNHLAAYQRMPETTLATSYRSVLWTNSKADAPIATDGGPFVVLLFNHGWGGRRTQDTFLTEDLASHGYVVAAIDHSYNAGRVAMPDGRIVQDAFGYEPIDVAKRTAAQIVDTWNKELGRWVDDEIFVLTALQNENVDQRSFWYGRLDTNRAGAFGHSFGGAASVQVCSADTRIRSALNMDGWTFGDIRHRAADQPIMFMYGTANIPRPQDLDSKDNVARTEAELDVNDAKQIDSSLEQYGGYKIYINNISHMDFTDHFLVSPWRNWTESGHIAPARIQTIVRAYVLAFFDQTLRGENPPLLQSGNSSPFHEVNIRHFVPESRPALVGTARHP
jgi:predicted dienelactone hydrolase